MKILKHLRDEYNNTVVESNHYLLNPQEDSKFLSNARQREAIAAKEYISYLEEAIINETRAKKEGVA